MQPRGSRKHPDARESSFELEAEFGVGHHGPGSRPKSDGDASHPRDARHGAWWPVARSRHAQARVPIAHYTGTCACVRGRWASVSHAAACAFFRTWSCGCRAVVVRWSCGSDQAGRLTRRGFVLEVNAYVEQQRHGTSPSGRVNCSCITSETPRGLGCESPS